MELYIIGTAPTDLRPKRLRTALTAIRPNLVVLEYDDKLADETRRFLRDRKGYLKRLSQGNHNNNTLNMVARSAFFEGWVSSNYCERSSVKLLIHDRPLVKLFGLHKRLSRYSHALRVEPEELEKVVEGDYNVRYGLIAEVETFNHRTAEVLLEQSGKVVYVCSVERMMAIWEEVATQQRNGIVEPISLNQFIE